MKKLPVVVLMGGQSVEHEVSLMSAQNVIAALNAHTYDVVPVGVTKDGRWVTGTWQDFLVHRDDPAQVALAPTLAETTPAAALAAAGVVFSVVHGTGGEDGTYQALFEFYNVPYVGPGVRSSAICFDKDVTKRLLREAGILVAPSRTVRRHDTVSYADVVGRLGATLFVKPANCGSSVGVSKVTRAAAFAAALDAAFRHDDKVLIEAAIVGRELECAVLGNCDAVDASGIGEVVVAADDFYSYDNKYLNDTGATTVIPADLGAAEVGRLQDTALATYRVLDCEGLARVDMFLTPSGDILVNEVNTIPGFTNISMYPKLWQERGLSYEALVDRLIVLALARKAATMS